jgi:hypothetical protein
MAVLHRSFIPNDDLGFLDQFFEVGISTDATK